MQPIRASIESAVAITPSDTGVVDMDAIWVGGGGNIAIGFNDPEIADVVFTAVPGGAFFECASAVVKATGTTATSMIAVKWRR